MNLCRGCDYYRHIAWAGTIYACHFSIDTGMCRSTICKPGKDCTVRTVNGERRTWAKQHKTTSIDVYKSLGEIQGALASHGARKIMVDYDGTGQPTGVMFGIDTQEGPRGFCLPANVAGVREVFSRQKVKAQAGQAERTAWRNVRDWVMAQMAIIGAGQVEMEEVFLPYLTDGRGGTLYQLYKGGHLALGCGED